MAAEHHAQSVQLINQQMAAYLSQDGRALFLNQMMTALESDTRNRFKGKDPNTYAWWKIHVQPNQWKAATIASPVEVGVDILTTLAFMDVSYRTKTAVSLRARPTNNADKTGLLNKGENFTAIAQVEGEPWLLVEQHGVIKGYLHQDYARYNDLNHDILSIKPNTLFIESNEAASDQSTHLLFGHYTCRDLNYELSQDGQISIGSLRACRKQRKIWYLDTPISHPSQS